MKNLIHQFYNEGFATTFIKRPILFINKKINNKTIQSILRIIIYLFYTVLVLGIAAYYIYKKIK